MPTPTYVPLANVTLASAASSVYFSSISQSYRHLVLVVETASTSGPFLYLQMNGFVGGSDYTWGAMVGASSTFLNQQMSSDTLQLAADLTGSSAVCKVDFFDYTATNKNKAVVWRFDRPSEGVLQGAGTLMTTGAINQIRVWEYGANTFGAGSTFALYGIAG